MAKTRALMTDTERERIAGMTDVEDIKVYQAKSRVRRRIEEELTFDAELLEEHAPDLYEELVDAVCPDEAETDRVTDEQSREAEPAPAVAHPDVESDTDVAIREQLRDELPGSGDLLQRRVDEIVKMYDYLRERGSAEKDDLLELVDVDATGYASPDSVWSNMVKGRDTLRALPGVETPPTGRTEWRYTGENPE